MDELAANIARRAAGRLEGEFGRALPALVERQLQDPGAAPQRYTGVEMAIAVAALLVSISQLAWQIYRDLKRDAAEAKAATAAAASAESTTSSITRSADALTRTLRLRIELPAPITPAHRDRLISVVVEEVLASDREGRGR